MCKLARYLPWDFARALGLFCSRMCKELFLGVVVAVADLVAEPHGRDADGIEILPKRLSRILEGDDGPNISAWFPPNRGTFLACRSKILASISRLGLLRIYGFPTANPDLT